MWLKRMLKDKVFRSFPVWIGALYIGLLLVGLTSKDHGIFVSLQLRHECNGIKEKLAQLKKDNAVLKKEWQRLKGDMRYVERLAREEYGMVGSHELVFVFPDSSDSLSNPDKK